MEASALQHIIKTLVRTASCKIDRCSCGAVHVSVGSVTMRVTDSAARELRDALNQAGSGLDARSASAPTPVIHLVDTRGNNPGDEDEGGGPQFH